MNVNSGSEVILLMTNSFLLIKKKKKKAYLSNYWKGFFLHLSNMYVVIYTYQIPA